MHELDETFQVSAHDLLLNMLMSFHRTKNIESFPYTYHLINAKTIACIFLAIIVITYVNIKYSKWLHMLIVK